jgi:hypothetical protein
MNVHPDWIWIVRKAWSFRLMVLACALTALEVGMPYLDSKIPTGVFGWLSVGVSVAALIARVVAQRRAE